MYSLEKIKKQIVIEINKALGKNIIQASDLVYPPDPGMGDLSLPSFVLSKKLGKNSAEIARDLVKELSSGYHEFSSLIKSIAASGPYINFILNKNKLAKEVLDEINHKQEKYGENKSGAGKKVVIEYSNVNTHKEYHVGHLRNICYGDAVNRILSANGYKSTPVSYVNDFGIHTAKTLWAYLEFYKDKKLPENKGEFLGKVYVRASQESKDNKIAKGMIEIMMKKIESRQGEEYELWQNTREWSIKQFDKIYGELGIKFGAKMYESEFIDEGKKMIPGLIKKGILEKSQGAIIANLEKYDLGVLVVLRSDGTATYPVADIPLAIAKFKKFKPDKSIYVVDARQSLYFKQLFKILELMGQKEEMRHLGFDVVKLPEGMMSSRFGNVVTYSELKEKIITKAATETRERHPDWEEKKINETAAKIGIGAMKFEMIKIGAGQIIVFDIEKSLRFTGFTAGYLQYTYARIRSIERKQKNKKAKKQKNKKIDFDKLIEIKEHGLIMKMGKYPGVVARAGEKYDPAEIAKYLFELAQMFNDYYHSVPVLKAEDAARDARLVLIAAVSRILDNGLGLLGIEVLEEM